MRAQQAGSHSWDLEDDSPTGGGLILGTSKMTAQPVGSLFGTSNMRAQEAGSHS